MNESGEFEDILSDKERTLMAAWTLPNEGALTDDERRQAMSNFARYIRLHNIKPAQVGRQLGKPKATTISELIKGVFRKDSDAHIRKLNMWVEQHARQQAAALTDKFVSTKVAKDVLAVARLTRENATMGLAVGPTGIGKTRCAQALHEKYVGSVYVRVMPGYHHPRGLTSALASALSVRDQTKPDRQGYQPTRIERVIETLRDSHRLLIIDEAHGLDDTALELLRSIHDVAGVPILLLATVDLHDRIIKNADPDRGQLYSRFDVVYHLTQGHDVYAGGQALYTVQDIKDLYNEPPIRLSMDAARYLQDVANQLGHGSLRRCEILLRNAVRRARKRAGLGDSDKVTVVADDLAWVEAHLRKESAEKSMIEDRRRRAAAAVSG